MSAKVDGDREGNLARYQAGIRTEARITDATRELLGEVGLEGTTLKAICDRAGVRAGSFYNLFETKDDAEDRILLRLEEVVEAPCPNTGSIADRLEGCALQPHLTEQLAGGFDYACFGADPRLISSQCSLPLWFRH